ncbi:MAG: C-terminal peptidase prc [Candidatus Omnitrophota bacterium]|jgi:C-terminal peptidase prc
MKGILIRLLGTAAIVMAILIFGLKPSFSQIEMSAAQNHTCSDCLTYTQDAFEIFQKHYYLRITPESFKDYQKLYLENDFLLLKKEQRPNEELKHAAVRHMIESLKNDQDRFTRFVPASNSKTFKQITEGIKEDSGIQIEENERGYEVIEVQKRSKAAESGIKKGQLITSIQNTSTKDMAIEEVQSKLDLPAGEEAQIEVKTQTGQTQTNTITGAAYEYETTISSTMTEEEGLGAILSKNESNGEWTVEGVVERSPAAKQNLIAKETIIAIDDVLIEEMAEANVSDKFNSPKGQVVQLKVENAAGEVRDLAIESKAFYAPTDMDDITITTPGILTLAIELFNDYSYQDTLDQIKGLGLENIQHIIIDLRQNMGGDGFAVIEFLSLFFNENELLFWVDVDFEPAPINALLSQIHYEGPITVLVNNHTGSAAELFANVLQKKKRGHIIGQNTEGSTLLKQIHVLSDQSSLYLTAAKVYAHDKEELGFKALVPDQALNVNEDSLDYALKELEGSLN